MKVLVLNSPVNKPIDESVFLEENEIQGLYSFKNSCQSFWTLKAICDLSKFREHKDKGEKKTE